MEGGRHDFQNWVSKVGLLNPYLGSGLIFNSVVHPAAPSDFSTIPESMTEPQWKKISEPLLEAELETLLSGLH